MGLQPSFGVILLGPLLLGLACPGSQDRSQRPAPSLPPKRVDAKEKLRLHRGASEGGEQAQFPISGKPAGLGARFSAAPQPIFRSLPSRSGLSAGPIPRSAPSIRWRFQTGRPIFASPILDAAGVTYIGSLDGSLYALDRDGRLRWRRPFADRIYASAALTARGIVVGADDDRVRLLDLEGRVLWSYPLGPCGEVAIRTEGRGPESVRCDADSSAVVAPDGTILLGGDALYALSPEGRLRWRLEAGGHLRSSPALGPDGTLYVGVLGGAVIAVSAEGKKRWEHRELYDFDSTPALTADGGVVLGCDDGRLYGLNASDGALRFRFQTRGPIRSSPAIAPDGTILFGSDDGVLRALNPKGALRWSFPTGGPVRSSPAVDASGALVFGSQDDSLYALARDGKLLWRVELGGDVDSSVAVAPDGTLLVGADDGVLYALGR